MLYPLSYEGKVHGSGRSGGTNPTVTELQL